MAKEKLELQVNIPTKIKLLQAEPATGVNSYGDWFLYNVECGDQEYSYFAPEKVVKLLQENNVGKDDEVVITKKLIKSGKKNITDYEVCVLENKAVAENHHQSNGSTNGYANGNNNFNESAVSVTNNNGNFGRTNGGSPALDKDYVLMLDCMTNAMMLRDELGHDVDVNKLGITLFLRKVKP
ncbi:MAG: hypothetical protein WAT71_04370 [Ignavibacteria bacterium]